MRGLYKLLTNAIVLCGKIILPICFFATTLSAQFGLEVNVFSGFSNISPGTQQENLDWRLPDPDRELHKGYSAGIRLGIAENLGKKGTILVLMDYHHLSYNFNTLRTFPGEGMIENDIRNHNKAHFLGFSAGYRHPVYSWKKNQIAIQGNLGLDFLFKNESRTTSTRTYALFDQPPATDTEYRTGSSRYPLHFRPSLSLLYMYNISEGMKIFSSLDYSYFLNLNGVISSGTNSLRTDFHTANLSIGVYFQI